MLKMMPGMQGMRDQLDAFDDREFDRVEAMVRSMTPFERTHPKQINGSRRARIAKGSGVPVTEVNQLLERFGQAQKMMKSSPAAAGGGLPGMPGIPGAARAAQAAAAQEEQERQPRQAGRGGAGRRREGPDGQELGRRVRCRHPGAGDGGIPADLDPASLPKGFEKFSAASARTRSSGAERRAGVPSVGSGP